MMTMLYTSLVVNLFTTCGDIALLKVNQIQRKRRVLDYNLLKSYQIAENEAATKIILILSLVHSVTFTSYLLSTLAARYLIATAGSPTYVFAIETIHLVTHLLEHSKQIG
uniref:Uncharacterized protein n=1 Tax=Ditylenchus dipsaci TaxID=166011 RepID=A0A915CZ66_9BILA